MQHAEQHYVVPALSDALLSWCDAVDLRIIHRAFPRQLPECHSNKHVEHTKSECVSAAKMQSVSVPEGCDHPAAAVLSHTKNEERPAGVPLKDNKQREETADTVLGKQEAADSSRPIWPHVRGDTAMERRQHVNEMRRSFSDVFNEGGPLKCMKGPPMRILLTENARAKSVCARGNIPVINPE